VGQVTRFSRGMSIKTPLIILGTSGLARELALLAQQLNAIQPRWEILGHVGEKNCEVGKNLGVAPILGDDEWLLGQTFSMDLVVGIGHPKVKPKALAPYLRQGNRFNFPNLIHPRATVDWSRVEIGRGNVLTAGCFFSCDITVGDFNLFNWNMTLGHDVSVGSYTVFNPGCNVSGYVNIGDGVLVGTGAQILENLSVGSEAVIGAGAVVTKPVEAGARVVGVPARPMQMSERND
jgi:sugar O-acyltransferase (sialic acid O-acetyltransferase NeuD family)